jgi:hypothetical protein
MNIEEIEINKIKNYNEYPDLHRYIEETRPFWMPNLLTDQYIYDESCINCRTIFLLFSKKITCSNCFTKIQSEINEFNNFIDTYYAILNKLPYDDISLVKHGINARIKLIMFTHRNELLNKQFTPCGIYYYCKQINLSIKNAHKILRMTENYNGYGISSNNYFAFLKWGIGASNKKLMRALETGKVVCPKIFEKDYYKYFLQRLKKYHNKKVD